MVASSLWAIWKDKPHNGIAARVLFNATNGISVNTRTRILHQERAPIAADLERSMRETTNWDVLTFALTADVSETHPANYVLRRKICAHLAAKSITALPST